MESTFDNARPLFLQLESIALSIPRTPVMPPHVSLTSLKFIRNVCHAGHWVRYRVQRSHGRQLAFTKYKELIAGLSFLGRKAFSFVDATISYILSLLLLHFPGVSWVPLNWILTERSLLGNACQLSFSQYTREQNIWVD